MQEALKAYRSKAESYLSRLDKSENEKAKAIAKAESGLCLNTSYLILSHFVSTAADTLKNAEAQHIQALQAHKKVVDQLSAAQDQLRNLEDNVVQSDREHAELRAEQQRLIEELQEERDRHQSELSERDFAVSQTQKTYQS